MSSPALDTVQLCNWLERWRSGDRDAADALLRHVTAQLEHLAHRTLGRYPAVKRWIETADVLQQAQIRLLDTLRRVEPVSVLHFFNLAAMHIRRELIDLCRRLYGPHGLGANVTSGLSDSDAPALQQALAPGDSPAGLEAWTRFHEQVEQLPDDDREVFSLILYHGWSKTQIAEVLGVTDRTVRRRYTAACRQLHTVLGDDLPQFEDPES